MALLILAGSARAQQMGPVGGVVTAAPVPPLSPQNGLQLSDGALLHIGVAMEGGYDSNVFYADAANRVGSSVVRVTPFLELTNTARSGEIPAGLFFDLRGSLTYREYLSSDHDITQLRSFTPSIGAAIEHNAKGTLAL